MVAGRAVKGDGLPCLCSMKENVRFEISTEARTAAIKRCTG